METLEAILFGIEPVTALVVGVGAILLVPIVNAIGSAITQGEQEGSFATAADQATQAVNAAGDSVQGLAKEALVWGLEVIEGVQTTLAEANESFQDFVAEARTEYEAKKAEHRATEAVTQPQEIEIIEN